MALLKPEMKTDLIACQNTAGAPNVAHGSQLLTSLWSSEARSLCSPLLLAAFFLLGERCRKSSREEKKRAGSGSTDDIWSERQKQKSQSWGRGFGFSLIWYWSPVREWIVQGLRRLSYWSGLSESSGGTLACRAVPQLVHVHHIFVDKLLFGLVTDSNSNSRQNSD